MNTNDNKNKHKHLIAQDDATTNGLSTLMDLVRKGPATEALERSIVQSKRRKTNPTNSVSIKSNQQQEFVNLNTMYNAIISGDEAEELFPEIYDIFDDDDDDDDDIPTVSLDFFTNRPTSATDKNNLNLSFPQQQTHYSKSRKNDNITQYETFQPKSGDKKLHTSPSTHSLLSFFKADKEKRRVLSI